MVPANICFPMVTTAPGCADHSLEGPQLPESLATPMRLLLTPGCPFPCWTGLSLGQRPHSWPSPGHGGPQAGTQLCQSHQQASGRAFSGMTHSGALKLWGQGGKGYGSLSEGERSQGHLRLPCSLPPRQAISALVLLLERAR